MNTLSKTLRLFLDSIGRRSEYEFYLNKFQSDRSTCFALVVPDSDSIQASGDLMSFDLHFLLRLGLCPLVVLPGKSAEEDATALEAHGAIERLSLPAQGQDLTGLLDTCVREERIPVLLVPDRGLDDLVPLVAPGLTRRIHVLRSAGMLQDPEGQKLFYITSLEEQALAEEDQALASMAMDWLKEEPRLHISISSPLYLLQEMFTVKGRGSILRPGSKILYETEVANMDLERLTQLVENAFGKSLSNPACLEEASDLFVEVTYRGAVLLEAHPAGKYLSKFAVGTEARGEGLAQELWETACAPQAKLFWRSRSTNPVNHWYERHATGHHTAGEWTVFWKGIPAEDLPGIIAYALDRPSDFVEVAGG